eukprot:s2659_g9.t1
MIRTIIVVMVAGSIMTSHGRDQITRPGAGGNCGFLSPGRAEAADGAVTPPRGRLRRCIQQYVFWVRCYRDSIEDGRQETKCPNAAASL